MSFIDPNVDHVTEYLTKATKCEIVSIQERRLGRMHNADVHKRLSEYWLQTAIDLEHYFGDK